MCEEYILFLELVISFKSNCETTMLLFLFAVLVAYCLGSVCSAVLVSRVFSLPDPKTHGSKNPGATNVLRIAGQPYALLVLLADILKGLIPVLLVSWLGAGPATLGFTCLAAVLGHIFPVFFGFKGGKGVATAIGGFLGLQFSLGAMVIVTWLAVAYFSRYSSLASIVAVVFAPFYAVLVVKNLYTFVPLLLLAGIVLYKHKDNIIRLMDGNESKMDLKWKVDSK